MQHLSYSVTGTCLTDLSINASHKCLHLSVIMSLYSYGSNWFLILFSVFSLVLDQYTWYKHHAGKLNHDGWLWITVRPVLRERLPLDIWSHWDKKSWLFGGKKFHLPDEKNRLSRAFGTSNFRSLLLVLWFPDQVKL